MNALLLRGTNVRKIGSLQSFNEYRQTESSQHLSSVTSDGLLLEYETLELRLHPPNVQIDNDTYDDVTVITIDSANRPGTLIEVVQCLTELGLSIRRARISSDGGWFVDEFFVTETPKGKVQDARKLDLIRRLLSVDSEAHQGHGSCSVFELSGCDSTGLLAAVLQLMVSNNLEVTSAAVWTFHNRVALVVSVTERGVPIGDSAKADRLQETLRGMLGGEDAVVKMEMVRGDIHHERRLHHLLLLEELRSWEEQQGAASQQVRLQQQQADDAAAVAIAVGALASYNSGTGLGIGAGLGSGGASGVVSAGGESPKGPRRSGSWSSMVSGAANAAALGALGATGAAAAAAAATAAGAGAAATGAGALAAGATATGVTGTRSGSETPATRQTSSSPAAPGTLPSTPPLLERVSSGPKATVTGASQMAPAPTAALSNELAWDSSMPHSPTSKGPLAPAEVKIQHSPILNYWLVTISSKDRNKLFFDTVCTFADLNYDVYHSTIDSEGDAASQLFYVRPRYGEAIWDAQRAHKLKYMLESAVQRRFPKGVKLHVQATDQRALLDLFQQLSMAGFWITRAEVRCHQDVAMYNFSLTDNMGQIPTPGILQRTCEMAGGVMIENLETHGATGAPWGGAGGPAGSAVLSRSETLPAARQLQALVAAAAQQKLAGSCRFAFCFLDKRGGTGGGSSSFRG